VGVGVWIRIGVCRGLVVGGRGRAHAGGEDRVPPPLRRRSEVSSARSRRRSEGGLKACTARRWDVARSSSASPSTRRACAHRGSDRKSTRLNSSHLGISYAVFCLKKKKKHINRSL